MEFEPKVLGEYEGTEVILFKDAEHGFSIRHNNNVYVLPGYCLGKDTNIYAARRVIEKFTEKKYL